MRHICVILLSLFVAIPTVGAADSGLNMIADPIIDTPGFVSVDELLYRDADDTQCATAVFARALAQSTDTRPDESAHETEIQQWIYQTFARGDVLRDVLACPEISGVADDESIKFLPIEYTFPAGRQIVINYETQPKILKQRLMLANKPTTPGTPSPRIGDPDDQSIWTNTDPAWYAIMVTQAGSLSQFVGPGKNNTISTAYIEDNIDALYPSGFTCTSKTAIANDSDMINRVMHQVVDIEGDTNDYYVAGDADLRWISYTEIALDVVLTVATMGAGTAVMGTAKSARAARSLKNISGPLRELSRLDSVRDYVRATQRYETIAKDLKKIDKAKDFAAYTKKSQELENAASAMRTLEKTDDIKKYNELSKTYRELNEYRHALRGMRTAHAAQRGNIVARSLRAIKAANTGGKTLNRGARIARSSMKSGKIRDRLFHWTMRNIGRVARMEQTGGLLYGALKFAGDMYDYTETSTGEFTTGIEFKPLLLLSADDLPDGQDNVVNYGMWLLWQGDTISAADDDAAYLQAMDTASKFHMMLTETQAAENSYPCDVDIYVVRPIIREPGTSNAELYYLIMNDEPWSTGRGAQ